jgi:hypothetical protein
VGYPSPPAPHMYVVRGDGMLRCNDDPVESFLHEPDGGMVAPAGRVAHRTCYGAAVSIFHLIKPD